MHVDCKDCADCCIDWWPVASVALDHECHKPHTPLDGAYNLVPLTRSEIHDFVEAGFDNALPPWLWEAPPGEGVEIGGVEIAVTDGKPILSAGIRRPPRLVTPFRLKQTWLRACAFPDPEALQCRIHDTELCPGECAEYPEHNPILKQETGYKCVERHHGDERLLDNAAPDDLHGLLLGPHALGMKLFVHPGPEWLTGTTDRLKRHELTPEGYTKFVSIAVGSYPDSTEIDGNRASRTRVKTLESESWAGEAIVVWDAVAGHLGSAAGDMLNPDEVETAHSMSETPGWGAVRDDG